MIYKYYIVEKRRGDEYFTEIPFGTSLETAIAVMQIAWERLSKHDQDETTYMSLLYCDVDALIHDPDNIWDACYDECLIIDRRYY